MMNLDLNGSSLRRCYNIQVKNDQVRLALGEKSELQTVTLRSLGGAETILKNSSYFLTAIFYLELLSICLACIGAK